MFKRVLPLRLLFTMRIAIIAGMALLTSACGPVPLAQYSVRRFYRESRGIRYDVFAAQPPTGDLGAYDRLAVEPLENQMEDRIPAELVRVSMRSYSSNYGG